MATKISEINTRIIDAIGTADFLNTIAKAASNVVPYDGLIIFLYSRNKAPAVLGCYNRGCEFTAGLENYVKYTYVLNPVYRAFLEGIEPMTYLISDLVSLDNETKIASSNLKIRIDKNEAIGYRTPGWPKNMTEVLGLIQLPLGKMVELNFLTTTNKNQIHECQQGLEQVYPVIASAIRKHFEFSPRDFDTSMANPSQEIRFQDFGKDILTTREMSIVKLILTGHSSNSITLILDISLPTVKTHRRNIYNKFQISSQAELFSLFVRHLMENSV